MHGEFVWYELSTPDVDAAQKFYPRFTGWGTQAFDNDYTMFTTGGVPIAGIFKLTDEMRQQGIPPNWMPYVETSNVDETAAEAGSLGAQTVYGPTDIPGAGRIAVLRDPQGATFGIYKSSNPDSGAWDGQAVVGRFSWHELMTTDYAAAFKFYSTLFGWNKTSEMDMGGGQNYFMYGKGDTAYGGMFNRFGDMENMPPFWLVYIHVPDVGKAVASAVKAGGAVHRPQMDIPGGSIAILGDPQGAGFALHHLSAQAAAAEPAAKKSAPAARKKSAPAAKKSAPAAKRSAASKGGAKSATKKSSKKKANAASRPKAKSKGNAARKAKGKGKRAPNARARARSAMRRATRRGAGRTSGGKKTRGRRR